MNKLSPSVIFGKNHTYDLGELEFYNDFDMYSIKPVYFSTHSDTEIVRACQGHKIESDWFRCIKGIFNVKLVEIVNWENLTENLKVFEYKLTAEKHEILYIAIGFKVIIVDSKLMIMSNFGFNEIINDQIRFCENKWTKWGN